MSDNVLSNTSSWRKDALRRIFSTSAPGATLLLRLAVGSVFLSEGIQKFLFSDKLGVGRFIKIGIPSPELLAPFVGSVEIICGSLILAGFFTRLAAIPLIMNMLVAIATTKPPMLQVGFWMMAHESRTDWAMILGSVFLLLAGAGPLSIDAYWSRDRPGRTGRPVA